MAPLSDSIYYTSLVLVILIYITTPIVFWQVKKFIYAVNFNDDFWRCRQPILTIVYIVSYLCVLYILNPLTIILYNIIGIDTIVPLFVNDVADMLIFLLLFPRAWILWFDRTFFDNLKNWLWRRELNPQDGNFLVRHRTTLKSSHIIVYSVYLLVVGPIFTTLNILPYFDINPILCDVMQACLLVLLFFLTWYIVRQISIVFDEHHIRKELLGTVKTSGVAYTFAHIAYVICEYIFKDKHFAVLIELVFTGISHMFVLWYALRWARVKYEQTQKIRLMAHLKQHDCRRSSFIGIMTKRIQFQDIMDNRNGIEAFCNHLQNEFGLESILFLLEVTQFKAIIRNISNGLIEDNVPKLCDWHSTDYASSTTTIRSKRVFSAASILNISWLPIDIRMYNLKPYQIALHLYDKYVDESADLTINISFSIRREIYRFFQYVLQQQGTTDIHNIDLLIHSNDKKNNLNDNNPLVKMYKIYDSAFTEIWRLIQTDSFLRFKSTNDFRRLATVLFPEEAEEAEEKLAAMVDREIEREKREKRLQKVLTSTPDSSSFPIPSNIHGNAFVSVPNSPDFATVLSSIPEETDRQQMHTMLSINNLKGKASNSLSNISRSKSRSKSKSNARSPRTLDMLKLRRSKSNDKLGNVPMLPYEQTSVPLIANLLTTNNIKIKQKLKKKKQRRQTSSSINYNNNHNKIKKNPKINNNNNIIPMDSPLQLINSQSLPTTPGEALNAHSLPKLNAPYAISNQPLAKTKFNRVYSNSQTLEENELKYTFTTINSMPSES